MLPARIRPNSLYLSNFERICRRKIYGCLPIRLRGLPPLFHFIINQCIFGTYELELQKNECMSLLHKQIINSVFTSILDELIFDIFVIVLFAIKKIFFLLFELYLQLRNYHF